MQRTQTATPVDSHPPKRGARAPAGVPFTASTQLPLRSTPPLCGGNRWGTTAWKKIRQFSEKNQDSRGKAGVRPLGVRKHKGRGKKIPSAPSVRPLRTLARPRVSKAPPGIARAPPGIARAPPGIARAPPGIARALPGIARAPPGIARDPRMGLKPCAKHPFPPFCTAQGALRICRNLSELLGFS